MQIDDNILKTMPSQAVSLYRFYQSLPSSEQEFLDFQVRELDKKVD